MRNHPVLTRDEIQAALEYARHSTQLNCYAFTGSYIIFSRKNRAAPPAGKDTLLVTPETTGALVTACQLAPFRKAGLDCSVGE